MCSMVSNLARSRGVVPCAAMAPVEHRSNERATLLTLGSNPVMLRERRSRQRTPVTQPAGGHPVVHLVIGSGPVGTTLALALVRTGERVRVVTRSGRGPDHPGIELVAADVTDLDAAAAAGADAAVVYGCANAPYSAAAWEEVWPSLQQGGLAAARAGAGRYVAVENLYTYGEVDGRRTEATPLAATGRKGR